MQTVGGDRGEETKRGVRVREKESHVRVYKYIWRSGSLQTDHESDANWARFSYVTTTLPFFVVKQYYQQQRTNCPLKVPYLEMEQEKLPSYKQYPTYSSETICTQFDISEEPRALAGNAKTICS